MAQVKIEWLERKSPEWIVASLSKDDTDYKDLVDIIKKLYEQRTSCNL